MSRNYIWIGLLLLPLMATSNLAYAGPQPSDRAWWPNRNRNVAPNRDFTNAPVAVRIKAAPQAIRDQPNRYQGTHR